MNTGKRTCAFCGDRANSKEHVFRRDWKKNFPAPKRLLYIKEHASGKVDARPETPFELKVRRACRICNNNWMADLDTLAERLWVLRADQDAFTIDANDVHELRRWAVKTAMMRLMIDNEIPDFVTATEYRVVRAGGVPDDWHIFLARPERWALRHAACGWGFKTAGSDALYGMRQISWSLGDAITIVVRSKWPSGVFDDPAMPVASYMDIFRALNVDRGRPLMELPELPTDVTFAAGTTRVENSRLESLFWHFSEPPTSSNGA